jgi:hypothetical protein
MAKLNTGMMQGWDNRNQRYQLAIIPILQHSMEIAYSGSYKKSSISSNC